MEGFAVTTEDRLQALMVRLNEMANLMDPQSRREFITGIQGAIAQIQTESHQAHKQSKSKND